jgi:hypothetical protein
MKVVGFGEWIAKAQTRRHRDGAFGCVLLLGIAVSGVVLVTVANASPIWPKGITELRPVVSAENVIIVDDSKNEAVSCLAAIYFCDSVPWNRGTNQIELSGLECRDRVILLIRKWKQSWNNIFACTPIRISPNTQCRRLAVISKMNGYSLGTLRAISRWQGAITGGTGCLSDARDALRKPNANIRRSHPRTLIDLQSSSGLIEANYQSDKRKYRDSGGYASDPIESFSLFKLCGAIVFFLGILGLLFGSFLMSDNNRSGDSSLDLRWKTGWLLTAVGTAAMVACLVAQWFTQRTL